MWDATIHPWPNTNGSLLEPIPLTKASDAELWCFFSSAPEQTAEKPVSDATALIMTSL